MGQHCEICGKDTGQKNYFCCSRCFEPLTESKKNYFKEKSEQYISRIRKIGSRRYGRKRATPEARKLYELLKEMGMPAELEKEDGHKTIDIAIPKYKVNLEIDGMQHNYSSKQALSDLKRTYYSFKRGFITLRIPNSLVRQEIEKTAVEIVKFLKASKDQIESEEDNDDES